MTATTPTALGRAFDLYRRTATSRSAIALVVANAIPVIGVLFFGWSLLTILVLFWVENGIVGFWNMPRILLARGSIMQSLPGLSIAQSGSQRPVNPVGSLLLNAGGAGRAVIAVWFLVHYGIFWAVHGIFVFALPNFFGSRGGAACFGDDLPSDFPFDPGVLGGPCGSPFGEVSWSNVTIAAAALFLSHGASFFLNYMGKREYLTTSAVRQMFAPYSRVVMLHLTIIFGAFFIALLGAPIGALVVLVVVKTVFDLSLHLRAHRTGLATPVVAAAEAG